MDDAGTGQRRLFGRGEPGYRLCGHPFPGLGGPIACCIPLAVLSGTSLMKTTSSSARNDKGAATRKTSPAPCPNADSTTVRTGAGSDPRSGMPPSEEPADVMPSESRPSLV